MIRHFIAGAVIYTVAQLYMIGPHGVEVLDALATVAGGLLIYIPLLMK